jgi:hypothetical protein
MAGSSNFLQHNPSAANQDTDAQYSADELRAGGIGFGNIIASKFLNKVLYQASTMVAALGQALANLGYTVNDSSLSSLTANLTTALATAPKVVQVTGGATTTLDCSQANQLFAYFEVQLTQNTIVTVENVIAGQIICVTWAQGASATYSALFSGITIVTGEADVTILGNGGVGRQTFVVNGALHLAAMTGLTIA